MKALRNSGVLAIYCVTGDHPAALGLLRPARFGAESLTLAVAASELSMGVTVGESPSSPGKRVHRLLAKQRAGATLCLLNHCGSPDDADRFVDECRAAGVTLAFVAPVPMVGSSEGAASLAAFPGLQLPDGLLAVRDARDPAAERLRWATRLSSALAATGRFVACNLSGRAPGADPFERAESTATFAEAIRHSWPA